MATNGGLVAINEAIPEVHATIINDPLLPAKSLISIIAFSDTAEVLLEATDAHKVDSFPALSDDAARRGTPDRCLSAAFTSLRHAVQNDAQNAEFLGYRMYPIYAFFIVGGEPTDDGIWQLQLENLHNDPNCPRMVAFGVDQVTPQTVRAIGQFASCTGNEGKSPARFLQEVIQLGADLDHGSKQLRSIWRCPLLRLFAR